jgi:hypothetical protein
MLAGAPAAQVSMLRFPGIDAYGALPAHLEGTTKAQAGACAPFVHFDSSTSEYLFWDLCADWTTPANSTLSSHADAGRGQRAVLQRNRLFAAGRHIAGLDTFCK